MNTDRRRASRGNTHDPYPCCGKDGGSWGREKNSICSDCKALIEEGKRARAKAEAERVSGQLQPFNWCERDYASPGYYGLVQYREQKDDHQKALQSAVFGLVAAVAVPKTPTTPAAENTDHKNWKDWPRLLDYKRKGGYTQDWQQVVLLAPKTRDAINQLDKVIRAVLKENYVAGKARGLSILQGLASGDVTITDFDDALLTPEEREQKRGR